MRNTSAPVAKRENFEELEAREQYVHGDKTITTVTYAGDKDALRHSYRFTLLEFKNDPDKFAVLLQTTRLEEWKRCKPILAGIAETAAPRKEKGESLPPKLEQKIKVGVRQGARPAIEDSAERPLE